MVAAATSCGNFYESLNWNILFVTVWSTHVNVGMCWNGSTAWRNWGPDCSITALPVYGTDISWCGVYQNGQWETNPGLNGDVYGVGVPTFKRYIWERYQVFGNGALGNLWGGG